MADSTILSIRVDDKDKETFAQLCRTRKQKAGVVFNELLNKLIEDEKMKPLNALTINNEKQLATVLASLRTSYVHNDTSENGVTFTINGIEITYLFFSVFDGVLIADGAGYAIDGSSDLEYYEFDELVNYENFTEFLNVEIQRQLFEKFGVS